MTARRIASILLFPAALAAQQPFVMPARIGVPGTASIGLPEVIQRVLASDRDLAVSRILRDEAVFNVKGARGVFDPRLGLTAHTLRAVTPVSSSIGGAANGKLTSKELLADPEISGASPWLGGSYRLDFSSARQRNDNSFTTLNPQYPASLTLNLTQPLWRGLLFDDNRHRIEVARKNVQMSEAQLRRRVIDTVTQGIEAWWELEYAYRNLEVQLQAVRLVEQQDASNRRQVEQGLLAPVDVVQTQTLIATWRQNVYTAQTMLTAAENNLKSLMLPDRGDLLWGMALVPEGSVEPAVELPVLGDAVKQALAVRPELQESTVAMEVNALDTRLSREQTRPQIDAHATLSTVGIAGRPVVSSGPNPFTAAFGPLVTEINALAAQAGIPPLGGISFGSGSVPPAFVGGYSQSLDNLGTGHFTSATVGVSFSFPLRNRTAIAASEVAAAEGRRLKAQRQQIEMAIEQEVRNALQGVSSSEARLESARSARGYAEEQYASEQRQFQAGTSTVFLVLQRQTDLVSARTREVRAEADLGEAKAVLDRALSRTLETRGIRLN